MQNLCFLRSLLLISARVKKSRHRAGRLTGLEQFDIFVSTLETGDTKLDTPALRVGRAFRHLNLDRTAAAWKLLWIMALAALVGCSAPDIPPAAGTTAAAPTVDNSSDSAEIRRLRELGAQLPKSGPGGEPLTNDAVTKLYLGATKFSAADLDLLLSFPNLEVLNLSNKKDLTDESLGKIKSLTHLKKLTLNGVPITDAGLAHLADLTDLEELWLIATKITDDGLAHITGCTKLATLSIEATEASDKCIENLKKLENLKVLHIKNSKITGEGVKELNAALPDCLVPK
jgi:Leucine-rich repeat (LRR) protein